MRVREKNKSGRLLAACCNTLAGVLLTDQLVVQRTVYAAAKPPPPSLTATEEQPATYRVRRGDTLLRIAKRLNLDKAHYYQTAVALFRKNPQAFINYNLNRLKVNKTLRLPDNIEIGATSLADAKKIVRSGRIRTKTPITTHSQSDGATKKPAQADQLAQTLLGEIKAIEDKRTQLQNQLPAVITQKQARMSYLTSLQALIQRLESSFAQYTNQGTAYQNRLHKLLARQQKLQTMQQNSRRTHHKLHAAVQKARLLQPKHMSWNQFGSGSGGSGKPRDANSFFRRIAHLKRKQHPLSPLLEQTEALYCAGDQQAAAAILPKFFAIAAPGTDWPDEALGKHPHKATLRAGSMDIVLATLHRNIERFPALSQLTERVVLQWDYCAMSGSGDNAGDSKGFYDLSLNREAQRASKAAPKVPLRWQGFERWGFSTDPAKDASRYIPQLLEAREPYHAYELFLHHVHRQHCFPHPDSGKVYTERTEERVFSRNIYPVAEQHSDTPYPYHWQPLCDLPQVDYQLKMAESPALLKRSQARLKQTENNLAALGKKIARLKQKHSEQQQVFQQQNKQIEQQIDAAKVAETLRKNQLKAQYTIIAKLDDILTAKKKALYPTLLQAQTTADAEQRVLEQAVTEEAIINAVMAMQMHRLAVRGAYGNSARVVGVAGAGTPTPLRKSESQASTPLSPRSTSSTHAHALNGIEGQESGRNIISARPSLKKDGKRQISVVSPEHRLQGKTVELKGSALQHKQRLIKESLPLKKGNALQHKQESIEGTPPLKKDEQRRLKAFTTKLSNTPKVNFTPPKKSNNKAEAKAAKPIKSTKPIKEKEKKLNITATALYTIPLSGDKPFGKLSASWKPKTNWFVRGAVKYLKDDDFTYSWGVGYSDWRPGTTSVQLNNWGPVKSGEGLDIDDAVFSISHKVDSEWLRDNKLSLSLGMSKPISGDAAFNATFQWNPIKNWYFRTTASQKLDGGPTKWSYGFGYFDWRPETWRVEYSNYETNRYPFDNFREGAVTINRAWEF